MSKNKVILLPWFPGHSDITGNETADALTLKDTFITRTTENEISQRPVKTTIRRIIEDDERLAIRTLRKTWKDLIVNTSDWPVSVADANSRLFSGHDCLTNYLYHIGLFPHSYISLCNGPAPFFRGKALHYLQHLKVKVHWQGRGRMDE
jgi:hypothetical protein